MDHISKSLKTLVDAQNSCVLLRSGIENDIKHDTDVNFLETELDRLGSVIENDANIAAAHDSVCQGQTLLDKLLKKQEQLRKKIEEQKSLVEALQKTESEHIAALKNVMKIEVLAHKLEKATMSVSTDKRRELERTERRVEIETDFVQSHMYMMRDKHMISGNPLPKSVDDEKDGTVFIHQGKKENILRKQRVEEFFQNVGKTELMEPFWRFTHPPCMSFSLGNIHFEDKQCHTDSTPDPFLSELLLMIGGSTTNDSTDNPSTDNHNLRKRKRTEDGDHGCVPMHDDPQFVTTGGSINTSNKIVVTKTMRSYAWSDFFGDRFKGVCTCCWKQAITPISFMCGFRAHPQKGGPLDIKNIVPVCWECHKDSKEQSIDRFIESSGQIPPCWTNMGGIRDRIASALSVI
jgi:hypothetical protein